MEEKEYNNIYAIPANYTDSGKLLGGMLEPRNAIETIIVLLFVGYPELMLIPMPGTVTLIPLGVVAMMGIDGDSLFQYSGHIFRYLLNRRTLHFRRIGYKYEQSQIKKRKKDKAA